MAQYQHQLQPFEENQSPSPVHEVADPFTALSLARSRSSRLSADAPSSPVNTLHRQLSGDPDAPPPAWKRRSSFTQNKPQIHTGDIEAGTSPVRSTRTSPHTELSPRQNLPPPVSRRHPQLQMTPSTRSLFTHESPNASSTSLYDPAFAPPQPAFLRSKGGTRSNRSSIHSTDTNGMTSEDLWNMDVEPIADLSNPQRSAMERPLDTVRRLSQRSERRPVSLSPHVSAIMPVDFMWPTAPPEEEPPIRRAKSKSTTSVPSLAGRQVRLGRKKTSADPQTMSKVMQDNADMPRSNSVFISGSAHSSTTDLSKGLTMNKSQASLARPPSTYYSRDFLSQLAPREGGYAIAAMLNSPTVAAQVSPGIVSAEEKRRSANLDSHRGSRPPTSRSAGMGRWSLDGGEHYNNRPYATSSANTTQSNLSTAPPINSPQASPPADEQPSLPDGASPPHHAQINSSPDVAPIPSAITSAPIVPSPLSRAVAATSPPLDSASDSLPATLLPIPTILAEPPRPVLNTKASQKQLARDNKAAEKAEAAKVLAQRAAKAKEESARKQAEKDKAKEMKETAKRKEKEEKERKKLEKRSLSKGTGSAGLGDRLKSPSQLRLGLMRRTSEVPPVPSSPAGVPFPISQNAGERPPASNISAGLPNDTRRNVSMPAGALSPGQSRSPDTTRKTKLGLFGTLRKRFSTMEPSSRSASQNKSQPQIAPIKLDAPSTSPDVASGSITQTPASTVVPSDSATDVGKLSVTSVHADAEARVVVIDDTEPLRPHAQDLPAPQPSMAFIAGSTPLPAPSKDLPPPPPPVTHDADSSALPALAKDLPPRTTSIHADSPGRISRSPSRTPRPTSSNESPASGSGLRARNSIQGPRPMPRSASVTSRASRTTPILPPVSALDSSSTESTALSQTESHLSSSGTYDSQTSQSVMTPADEPIARAERGPMGGKGAGLTPEREDSAETVRVELGREVAAH